jgi:hypothetical protein
MGSCVSVGSSNLLSVLVQRQDELRGRERSCAADEVNNVMSIYKS